MTKIPEDELSDLKMEIEKLRKENSILRNQINLAMDKLKQSVVIDKQTYIVANI